MTKLNKNQLSKTSNMNIRELNILLSEHKGEVFKRMNTKFEESEFQVCPFCAQKTMKHRKIKSSFEKLDNFYCDNCGKYENIFDLFLCFKIKNGRNLILNSKTLKSMDFFEQKPYFDETLKELYKLVANSLLKEKTNAENKIKKMQNFLKFEEEKEFFEKIDKISEEKPVKTLAFEKFNEEFGTDYKNNLEILKGAVFLDEKLPKFELSKKQLKDLYFINPKLYALKNFNFISIKDDNNDVVSFMLERKILSDRYSNKYSVLKNDKKEVFYNINNFVKTDKKEMFIIENLEVIYQLKKLNLEYKNVVASLSNNYTFSQKMSLFKYVDTKFYVCFENKNLSKKLKADLEKVGLDAEILTFEEFKRLKGL